MAEVTCGNGFSTLVSSIKRQPRVLATNRNSTSSSLSVSCSGAPVFAPNDVNSWSFDTKVEEFATMNRKYANLVEVLLANGVDVKFYDDLHEDVFKVILLFNELYLAFNLFYFNPFQGTRHRKSDVSQRQRIYSPIGQ